MKLSYKQWKPLMFADKNICRKYKDTWIYLRSLKTPKTEEEKVLQWIEDGLAFRGWMFDKPIYFVSDTFLNAVIKNETKIADVLNDNWEIEHQSNENCIFVFTNGTIITHFSTSEKKQIVLVQNQKGEIIHCSEWETSTHSLGIFFTMDEKDAVRMTMGVKKLLLFKKFASVELEVIKANSRKKVDFADKGKVINEMGIDVSILDSRWFREIIRNEGFKVRGHFRLQPCKDGNGNWTRKIIYIEEFEKHGYHRRAQITIEKADISLLN